MGGKGARETLEAKSGYKGGKQREKPREERRGGHEGGDEQKGLRQPYTDGRTGAAADQ